jgi:hypothetical protein
MDQIDKSAEHFVTYFDKRYLLQGLSLYESINRWMPNGVLWVICLDLETADVIQKLSLPNLYSLLLEDVETSDMLSKKDTRSRVEYIYMLTPFTFYFVREKCQSAKRVTYVDADIYFFSSPKILFEELENSGKSVLITEHGYSSEYEYLKDTSGMFCVQFLPIIMNENGLKVIIDWQNKCLESTGTAINNRKIIFGDQKYLEEWPLLFSESVHISKLNSLMLAPWNVHYQMKINGENHIPVFYHFHSFKFISNSWVQCCVGFDISLAIDFYKKYISSLKRQLNLLKENKNSDLRYRHSITSSWNPKLFFRYLIGKILLRRI